MPTYEMFWDCGACGSTKLLGKSHRHCPNCGTAQDAEWRYFPADHERVAVEDHVFVGIDLECAHCETPNSRAAQHCVNCGAAIGDGDDQQVALVGTGPVELGDPGEVDPQAGPAEDDWKTAYQDDLDDVLAYQREKSRRTAKLVIGSIGVLLISALVLFLVWNFWTRPAVLKVTHHSWERRVHVERLQAVRDGSWCDSMPYDAYSVSRSRQERSTNRIPDGEVCSSVNVDNGDGTFSTQQSCSTTYREEPVYDDYCDYTVDRWRHDHTETAGARGMSPRWPSVSASGCSSLGCTREGGRDADYNVHLVEIVDEPHTHECDYDEATWRSMRNETEWTGKVRMLTGSLKCGGLDPI